jgi:hypothetical protein
MFKTIGLKFIDPDYEESGSNEEKEMERIRKQTVKINKADKDKGGKEGKGCC